MGWEGEPGLGLGGPWRQAGGKADPHLLCPPSKTINFPPESHLISSRDKPPQTTAPILKLLQGPEVWAQEGLGSPPPRWGVRRGALEKEIPLALCSLQWKTLKAAGELGLLGSPPCWGGNALEVS